MQKLARIDPPPVKLEPVYVAKLEILTLFDSRGAGQCASKHPSNDAIEVRSAEEYVQP